MTYIIAEAGTNHAHPNYSERIQRVIDLIKAAARTGANAVKFQAFFPDEPLFCPLPGDDRRRARWDESYLAEVDWEEGFELARDTGIDFLLSVFQPRGIAMLKRLRPKFIKVASRAKLSFPYKMFAAAEFLVSSDKPLCHLAKNLHDPGYYEPFSAAFLGGQTGDDYRNTVQNLYCLPIYPAPLGAMKLQSKMRNHNGMVHIDSWLGESCIPTVFMGYTLPCPGGWKYHGLSDHSGVVWPGLAAIFDGAKFLEVHFNLGDFDAGPDKPVCLTTDQLKLLCEARDAAAKMR